MNILDDKTLEGVAYYGDAASERFYAYLKEKRFRSTRCVACGRAQMPPRDHCSHCLSREVEWFDLPTRGTLYAFTRQRRAMRFTKPRVIGLVELPEVGRFLSHIAGDFESLRIGQELEMGFCKVSERIVVHEFRPVEGPV